jgi:hypothetical protein
MLLFGLGGNPMPFIEALVGMKMVTYSTDGDFLQQMVTFCNRW